MQNLEFNKPNDLSQLHDELIAQVPTFHRIIVGQDGQNKACEDCGRVKGLGDYIRLTFADDIDPVAMTAVVNAHELKY